MIPSEASDRSEVIFPQMNLQSPSKVNYRFQMGRFCILKSLSLGAIPIDAFATPNFIPVSIPKDMHFGIATPARMTFGFANATI
jgi:hypothetical protein